MDLTAQLDDELGFCCGDLISIISLVDEDTAMGEIGGKTGTFFLDCVEVMEGKENLRSKSSSGDMRQSSKSKFDWWKEPDAFKKDTKVSKPVTPPVVHQQSVPPPMNTSDQAMSFRSQDVPPSPAVAPLDRQSSYPGNAPQSQDNYHDVQYSASSAPINSSIYRDNSPKGCASEVPTYTHRRTGSYTQTNTRSSMNDSGIQPYGKTLFPFIAENPNELTFFDNEIVNLIRHIDEQWMEGEIDGKIGIFPSNYVEVIVDCLWADEYDPNDSSMAVSSELPMELEYTTPEWTDVYGRVMFDFTAETSEELTLSEGDTVTVLRQLDDEWFQARHDDGKVGLCPVNYVELISSDPAPTPNTPSIPKPVPSTENSPVPKSPSAVQNGYVPPQPAATVQTPPKTPSPNSTLTKPAVTKPKPQLKPKPQVKPKPKPSIPPRADTMASESPTRQSPTLTSEKSYSPTPTVQKASSIDATLDAMISSQLVAAKDTGRPSSITEESQPPPSQPHRPNPPNFAHKQNPNSPFYKAPDPATAVGKSNFYNAESLNPGPKRLPPPRPYGPRPAPAPPKTPLQPQNVEGDREPLKPRRPAPVPNRPAPPRPTATPIRPGHGDNLMEFSPERGEAPPIGMYCYLTFTHLHIKYL